MLPAVIIVVAALLHTSAITEAATLRSSDGVDYAVDNDRVIDHCTLLRHVLTDTADGGPIPLPAIPSTHLKVLVEFMKQTAANDQTARGSQWIQAMLGATTVPVLNTAMAQESADLLTCAHYVGMESLARAIMWTRRTWADVAALRDHLHQNAFWFAVHNCPALDRLRRIAMSTAQAALVGDIPDLVVRGANVAVVERRHLDQLLQQSARCGDEVAVELLLNVPGIDVNAFTTNRRATALHNAVACNHTDVVRVLLDDPRVDVNPRAHPTSWTPLHLAASLGLAPIVKLLLDDPRVDVSATDDVGWTAADRASWNGHSDIEWQIHEYRWGILARVARCLSPISSNNFDVGLF
ncbi:SKP1 component POZ domain-containing protein [Plasmodiophora brassicae]|uniref:SKP1 component POZ domain-containing protein n=1 Tax=Plasmodiophora brassicae TaxID=37360 RepID=A0A0G4J2I7_PLABS|nr:hypothetical protein PBRA_008785 [Plasmodiophora brassicae]